MKNEYDPKGKIVHKNIGGGFTLCNINWRFDYFVTSEIKNVTCKSCLRVQKGIENGKYK